MKHRRSALTVGMFLILFSAHSFAQQKQTLTLPEAIDLSIKNSKQLKSSAAKIEEATAALKEAVERRLPDASVSGSYLRLNNPNINLKTKKDNYQITSLLTLNQKKMASYLNHTATTDYLCCVPTLEDSQELVV